MTERDKAAAPTPEGLDRPKPKAWVHTLNMELCQRQRMVTFSQKHPFGRAGIDFDPSYTVTSLPLFSESVAPAAPAPEGLDVAPQPVACPSCLSRHQPCYHLNLGASEAEQRAWKLGAAEALRSRTPADATLRALAEEMDFAVRYDRDLSVATRLKIDGWLGRILAALRRVREGR